MRRVWFAIILILLVAAMFSEARARRAVAFFESLRHTKGQFSGKPFTLLPWQKQIVRDVYGNVNEQGLRQVRYVYLEVPKKNGKALAIDTTIPTPTGWRKMKDLAAGDKVFDENGKQCNVVSATDVMYDQPCYLIRFTNGQEFIADANHQWLTSTRRPEAKTAIRTTADIASTIYNNGLNHRIEIPGAIEIEHRVLPIDPYLFGLWPGDGNSQRKQLLQSVSAGHKTRASRVYIESCEPVQSVPVKCIQVDSPSKMYLAGETFIPTHNSEIVAGSALYHTFADGERNGEVYGCAADKEQASIVFDVAVDMIDQVPALKKRAKLNLSTKMITDRVSGTFYKVVSSEAYSKHGLNVSACVFDELHAQPNRDLWDVMTFGAGDARAQPIWWVITTAGDDPDRVSIGWEQHEKAMKILAARDGTGNPEDDEPTWYPVIYGYQGEDIYNEANWYLANPSLGVTIDVESVREAARKAKKNPAEERLFRWLRLNQWLTYKLTSWQPVSIFDSTVGQWGRADLVGRDCYLGIDLSSTTDLTAICLVFPPQGEQMDWRVIWECWIPRANMAERIVKDHVPYDEWERKGWLNVTEGDVVDYTAIRTKILEMKGIYNILEVDSDRAFAAMLLQELEQSGLNCVDIPQTFVGLTNAINQTEVLLGEKKLTHENNLTARWCFGNTSVAKNGNGQVKFVKEHKGKSVVRTKRIDATAAWINAMARAVFYKGSQDLSAAILDEGWGM